MIEEPHIVEVPAHRLESGKRANESCLHCRPPAPDFGQKFLTALRALVHRCRPPVRRGAQPDENRILTLVARAAQNWEETHD